MKLTSLLVPEPYLKDMDLLVKQGFYPNRSELIRLAIRQLLQRHGFAPWAERNEAGTTNVSTSPQLRLHPQTQQTRKGTEKWKRRSLKKKRKKRAKRKRSENPKLNAPKPPFF